MTAYEAEVSIHDGIRGRKTTNPNPYQTDFEWFADATADTGDSYIKIGRPYVVMCQWTGALFIAPTHKEALGMFREHEQQMHQYADEIRSKRDTTTKGRGIMTTNIDLALKPTAATPDWEALPNGATPGPWEVLEVKGSRVISRPHPDGGGWAVAMILQEDDQDLEEANANLLASAPDAVAEVIRLRREIEAMRDDWEHAAERTAEMVALWPHGHRAARTIKTRQQVSRRLTRILEGSSGK